MIQLFLFGGAIFCFFPPPIWNALIFNLLWCRDMMKTHSLKWHTSSTEAAVPWEWEDLTRSQCSRSVLFYVLTGRENKKNGPKTISIIHLCFHRPPETASKAMEKLVEIEIQATQVRNCLVLKSFRDDPSNKSHIKCSESDITLGLNSFEMDIKNAHLFKNYNCQASASFNWHRMQ